MPSNNDETDSQIQIVNGMLRSLRPIAHNQQVLDTVNLYSNYYASFGTGFNIILPDSISEAIEDEKPVEIGSATPLVNQDDARFYNARASRALAINGQEIQSHNGSGPYYIGFRQVNKQDYDKAVEEVKGNLRAMKINRMLRLVKVTQKEESRQRRIREYKQDFKKYFKAMQELRAHFKLTVNTILTDVNGGLKGDIKESIKSKIKYYRNKLKEDLTEIPASAFYFEIVDRSLGKKPVLVGPYYFEKTNQKIMKLEFLRSIKRDILEAISQRREERRQQNKISKHSRQAGVPYSVVGTGRGGVFTASNTILKMMKDLKVRRITKDKTPLSKERHIGVEIECFLDPYTNEELADSLIAAGVDKKVCVKDDGSLSTDEEGWQSTELTVCDSEANIEDTITKVCKVISDYNGMINETCGLHVHLDMRDRPVTKSAQRLIASQPFLFRFVPGSRRSNQYCRPTHPSQTVDMTGQRYKAVNLASYDAHSTIEVRLHSGTVEANKINNWVKLLVKIADTELKKPAAELKTLNQWFTALKLPTAMKTYFKARAERFSTKEEREKGVKINYVSFMNNTRLERCDAEGDSEYYDCEDCGTEVHSDDANFNSFGHDVLCNDCYCNHESDRDEEEDESATANG